MVSADDVYQELLHACLTLEPEFLRIRASLSCQEQDILERYLALCEELDYRRLMLALAI
ncbi:MAG: hypothetical protein ACI3V0_01455 [Faecousia sp.]